MLNYAVSSLQLQVNWRIKREPVFRLLDSTEWIDNFFNTGEIMVSCFSNFKKYPDEIRGDIEEGEASIGGEDENGTTKFLKYEAGQNAFIMSTTNEINDKIINDFQAKCAIKINHPTLFGLEVSRKIPFVTSGLEGNCDYTSSRLHFFQKEVQANKDFQKLDFVNDPQSRITLSELTMGMELFLKLEKYGYQKEYRFVWFSNRPIGSSLVIKCPEAVDHCEKIIF